MVEHAEAAGALPGDGDLVRVAHEAGDVVPDPEHGEPLVQQPLVAGRLLQPEGEEAEGSESVVDGDEDDVVRHPQLGPIPVTGAWATEVDIIYCMVEAYLLQYISR